MGFSRQEYWSGVPLPSPGLRLREDELRNSGGSAQRCGVGEGSGQSCHLQGSSVAVIQRGHPSHHLTHPAASLLWVCGHHPHTRSAEGRRGASLRTILAELEGRVAQPSRDQPVGGAGSNSAWGWLTWCQVANNTSPLDLWLWRRKTLV